MDSFDSSVADLGTKIYEHNTHLTMVLVSLIIVMNKIS